MTTTGEQEKNRCGGGDDGDGSNSGLWWWLLIGCLVSYHITSSIEMKVSNQCPLLPSVTSPVEPPLSSGKEKYNWATEKSVQRDEEESHDVTGSDNKRGLLLKCLIKILHPKVYASVNSFQQHRDYHWLHLPVHCCSVRDALVSLQRQTLTLLQFTARCYREVALTVWTGNCHRPYVSKYSCRDDVQPNANWTDIHPSSYQAVLDMRSVYRHASVPSRIQTLTEQWDISSFWFYEKPNSCIWNLKKLNPVFSLTHVGTLTLWKG